MIQEANKYQVLWAVNGEADVQSTVIEALSLNEVRRFCEFRKLGGVNILSIEPISGSDTGMRVESNPPFKPHPPVFCKQSIPDETKD